MTCPGCGHDVPMVLFSFCDFCSRLVRQADIDRWHRDMVAPRKHIEERLEDNAIREGGG